MVSTSIHGTYGTKEWEGTKSGGEKESEGGRGQERRENGGKKANRRWAIITTGIRYG